MGFSYNPKRPQTLKILMEQVVSTPEQPNYLSNLLGLEYPITYKPRKDNLVADTFFHQIFLVKLVRKNPHLMGFSTSKFFSRSRKPNQPELIELHDLVKSNTLQYLGLKIRDVYYTEIGVLLLSSKPQLKQQLLHEFHLTPASGHRGISKTSADFRPICFGQR